MKYLLLIVFLFAITTKAQPGSIDISFNPSDKGFGMGDGPNDYVKEILLQSDGRMIIAGDFKTYNANAAKSIVRIKPDGDFDRSFQVGSGANNYINCLAFQADGKILAAGDFTTFNGKSANRIVRLLPDGSIDSTFKIEGGANDVIECIAIQNDGKILIGGQFTKYNGITRKFLARLNIDGTLDTSFDTTVGFNSHVYSIAIQQDGKILLGGNFTTYNALSKNFIVRLNSDASVDESFVSSGTNNIVYRVLLSDNGQIFLGGKFTKYNNSTKNSIVKLNTDGSIDKGFEIGTGANNVIRNIITLKDKKLLLVGDFTSYNGSIRNYIARLNDNGSIDNQFSPGKGFSGSTISMLQDNEGKMMVVGSFTTFDNQVKKNISRLNADGSLDRTFNPGNAADGFVKSISIQADKKMLIAGSFSSYNDNTNNKIARLYPDGTVDTSFQVEAGADQLIRCVVVQNDNKILIGGDFLTFNNFHKSYLAKLNSTGELDNSFNTGFGPSDPVREILIQPDGKILICGDFTVFNTKIANHIIRLNSDGTIDQSFLPKQGSNGNIYSMRLQPDNKILIAGSFTSYDAVSRNRLARLNSDGTLDTSFNIGIGANNIVSSLLIQNDGKIVIGGNFTSYASRSTARIARINIDGSIDTSFVTTGGANDSVETLAIQENGKILIGGSFTKYNNTSRNHIARLKSDGTLDETFNSSVGTDKMIYKLISLDGKIVAVGDFTSYSGIGRNRITRINGGEVDFLNLNDTQDLNIKIFPNPVSDKIFLFGSSSCIVKYQIFNILGQKLSENYFNQNIDVSHLKKGMYILKLTDENQKNQTTKFIIK